MQDYSLSETGSQLISFESHVYGRNKVNIDKELCICFVLFEAPFLVFYCKMGNHDVHGEIINIC